MLKLETPVTLVYRRSLQVAATDITSVPGAVGEDNNSLALDTSQVDIAEGQWVTLDADGNATLVSTPTALAMPVYAGGERLDVNGLGKLDALFGKFIAETDQFRANTGDTYAAGTALTVENGLLRPAAGAEAVVAIAEGAASAATTAYPNGLLKFQSRI